MQSQSSAPHQSVTLWRAIFAFLGIGLGVMILWASFSADIIASFGQIVADPWGAVAIADLYLGFFIFAAFVFLVDGVKPVSFVWVIALMFLGNVLSIVWLVLRLPLLVSRLRG
ncbi:MAG: hypothetical protein AB8B88_05755 [Devosiaceae bacterium]